MRVSINYFVLLISSAMMFVLVADRSVYAQGTRPFSDRSEELDYALTLDTLLERLDEQDAEIVRLRYELNSVLVPVSAPPLPTPNGNYSQNDTTGRASLTPGTNGQSSMRSSSMSAFTSQDFSNSGSQENRALNLNNYQSLFDSGIVIQSNNVAMKIGGYVKVDVIHDFQPVGDQFKFDTTTILVNVPPYENSRTHARQSRLNFDTRWETDLGIVRSFVEGDFFGDGNDFRLRHAYGEVRNLIVGQTWSTFANTRALPPTLDNEGSASVISQRQGQVRWTQKIFGDDLSFSVAVENPQITLSDSLSMLQVQALTESPDLVTRLRYENDESSLQVAAVARRLGIQTPTGRNVEADAWGVNFSGSHHFTKHDEGYCQIIFGEGIGSYKNSPDVVSDGVSRAGILPLFGWMVGWNHRWTDVLQSNLTYSQNLLDNPSYETGTDLHQNTYFSTNLIYSPADNFFMGIEYLYGIRQNVNLQDSEAHRLQTSFGFYLP